jgi:hypothetical protein
MSRMKTHGVNLRSVSYYRYIAFACAATALKTIFSSIAFILVF